MISGDVIALNRQPSGQAENNDAGQDRHRYNASDATIEATAREMTCHGFNSDSSSRLTAACDDSSAVGQLMGRALGGRDCEQRPGWVEPTGSGLRPAR
jgi:hypothetical protein